jgi:hypothetical protein
MDAQGFTTKWRRRFRLRTDFSQFLNDLWWAIRESGGRRSVVQRANHREDQEQGCAHPQKPQHSVSENQQHADDPSDQVPLSDQMNIAFNRFDQGVQVAIQGLLGEA